MFYFKSKATHFRKVRDRLFDFGWKKFFIKKAKKALPFYNPDRLDDFVEIGHWLENLIG